MKLHLLPLFCLLIICTSQGQSFTFNDICQRALPLTNQQVVEDTLGFTSVSTVPSCETSEYKISRGLWYSFAGENKIIDIVIENKYLYSTKAIIYEGDCSNLTCFSLSTNKFLAEENKQYYLYVESANWYSLNQSPFKITFNEYNPEPTSSCSTAAILDCGQEYTFEFKKKLLPSNLPGCSTYGPTGFFRLNGDGQTKEFDFQTSDLSGYYLLFFESDNCNKSKCIGIRYLEPNMNFATTNGKTYLIAMVQYFEFASPEIKFNLNCNIDLNSKKCESAEIITCGNMYTAGQNPNAYPEVNNIYSLSSWYKIEGNDNQFKCTFIQNPSCRIKLYKSTNECSELNLYLTKEPFAWYNSLIIDTEINSDYYIEFIHQSNEDIVFTLGCNDVSQDNFSCMDAKNAVCGQVIQIYNFSDVEGSYPNNFDVGQWYRFEGSDSVYRLSNPNPANNLYDMTIFKDDCDSLQLIEYYSSQNSFNNPGFIDLKIKHGESYLVRFNTSNNFFNSFNLAVSCLPSTLFNSVCITADSLFCDKNMNLDYSQVIDISENYCDVTKGMWYKFKGTGDIFVFPFQGLFGKCVFYEGSCDEINCLYTINTGYSDFNFKTEVDKDYLIHFSIDFPTEDFPVRKIKCEKSVINHDCPNALNIDCETQSITLDYSNTSFYINDGLNCATEGYGLWYKLEGNNKLYRFDVNPVLSSNLKMASFVGDDCNDLVCVLDGVSENLKFYAEEGSTYYVLVTSSDLTNGNEINISCGDPEQNSQCSESYDITCDSSFDVDFGSVTIDTTDRGVSITDLWFKFTGNDSLITFSKDDDEDLYFGYQIFINSCDSLLTTNITDLFNLQFYRNPFSLYAQKDKTYYIRFVSHSNNKYTFKTKCSSVVDGDICSSAKPVNCGNNYTFNTSDYSPDYFGGVNAVINGAWFVFDGNDTYLEVDRSAFFEFKLFESIGDCSQLNEVTVRSYNGSTINFYAKSGIKYYFLVGTGYIDSPDITGTIALQCIDADMNAPDCTEARIIQCGESFRSNNLKEVQSTFGNCAPENLGDWFKFEGDGFIWTFFISSSKYSLNTFQAYIATGSCDELQCVTAFDIREGWSSFENRNSFSFSTVAGETYFLKLASFLNEPMDMNISVLCLPISTNLNCASALNVNCGDVWQGNLKDTPEQNPNDDACKEMKSGHYYEITGTGEYFIMSLDNYTGSTGLRVSVIENDCENGRCLYQGALDSQFTKQLLFEAKNNRKYIIKIYADQDNVVYKISTKCAPLPDNTTCESAAYLNCSTTFDLDIQTPMGFSGDVPCFNTQSAAYWYFLPKTDSLFELEILEKTEEILFVEIVKGSCNNFTCLQSFTNNNQRFAFSTQNDDDHYVVIHSNANIVNNLKLRLSCVQRPENDFCSEAFPITCGDTITGGTYLSTVSEIESSCFLTWQNDVWYSFESSGDKNSFLFEDVRAQLIVSILEAENCDGPFICKSSTEIRFSEAGTNIEFVGEAGKTYYLKIQNYYIESSLFTITMSCSESVPNDLCTGAAPLTELNELNFENSTGESFQQMGICSHKSEFGIWYFIDGNDSIAHIYTDVQYSSFLYYSIFTGECNKLTCMTNGQFYNPEIIKFRADKGKRYYILFYKQYPVLPETYPVRLRFDLPATNDYCDGSDNIYCGDTIIFNTDFYSKDSLSRCLEDRSSAWFRINGDSEDKVIKLESDFPNIDFAVEVFEVCDTFCVISEYFYRNNSNSLAFVVQKGQSFYVRINFGEKFDNEEVRIFTSCRDLDFHNITKETSIPLECKSYSINTEKMYRQVHFSCFSYFQKQLYYKFTGDGSIFKLKRPYNSDVAIFITKGDECSDIGGINFYDGEFLTEAGQEYFLVVAVQNSFYKEIFNFGIEYNCISDVKDIHHDAISIQLVPNPFYESPEVRITTKISQPSTFKVVDLTGKVIWMNEYYLVPDIRNSIKLNETNSLPPGVYILQIHTDRTVYEQKMIKIR
ncbi:MAG: T9SS type A sorting domain-containing protein [Saprospiraceae bacterium]|nr:T9SS type A sorting domain-containing protein [Saprospiraceae bacterium]